jgi:outer membrane protein
MKRSSLTMSALTKAVYVSMLCALPVAFASAELRVGVLNTDLLIQESPYFKTMQQTLQTEFAARQREGDKLQKDYTTKAEKLQKDGDTMIAADKTKLERDLRDLQRDIQRKEAEFKEDVSTRQNEELQKLQRAIGADIQAYAKSQNLDLVIPANAVLYVNESLNITPQMVQAIREKAPATAKPATPAAGAAPTKK